MTETAATGVGEAFAQALLSKKWGHLESLLNGEVDFRGLTPRKQWEASTPKDLIDTVFTQWFGPTVDIYEITEIATERISDRHRVVYRFRVRRDEDDFVCEQTAYFDEADGRIVTLRILCTGFLPAG